MTFRRGDVIIGNRLAVGTNTPSATLHVAGDTRIDSNLTVQGLQASGDTRVGRVYLSDAIHSTVENAGDKYRINVSTIPTNFAVYDTDRRSRSS